MKKETTALSNGSAYSTSKIVSLLVLGTVGTLALVTEGWILQAVLEQGGGRSNDNYLRTFSISTTMNACDGLESSPVLSEAKLWQESTTPPNKMVGQWIGKTWIPPPPWRYFGADEIRELYKDKKVLWFGDSTARRSFATMYGIMNETTSSDDNHHHVSSKSINDPSIIDVNKVRQVEFCNKWTPKSTTTAHLLNLHPKICRPAPEGTGGKGEFSYVVGNCFHTIEMVLESELAGTTNMTADVDVIIFSNGIWEIKNEGKCNNTDGNDRSPMERLNDALSVASKFSEQTGKTIVWRTGGYGKNYTVEPMDRFNDRVMEIIDALGGGDNHSSLVYVNWGAAMKPRSFGPDEIKGDIDTHYGVEARIVLIQMITNRLKEHGFFD